MLSISPGVTGIAAVAYPPPPPGPPWPASEPPPPPPASHSLTVSEKTPVGTSKKWTPGVEKACGPGTTPNVNLCGLRMQLICPASRRRLVADERHLGACRAGAGAIDVDGDLSVVGKAGVADDHRRRGGRARLLARVDGQLRREDWRAALVDVEGGRARAGGRGERGANSGQRDSMGQPKGYLCDDGGKFRDLIAEDRKSTSLNSSH